MKKKLLGIFVCMLMIATSTSVVGNGLKFTLPAFDVGVGEPTNIHYGDYRPLGEDTLFVTVQNHGDLPASVDLDFTLERLEGGVPIVVLDEGFEDSLFPPQGWQVHQDGNQLSWQRDIIIGHESSACAGLFAIWPPTPPMIFDEWLVTESIDFREVTSLMLSFWYYGHSYTGLFMSNLEIWASTEGGANPDDFLATGILLEDINPVANEVWISESVDLSPFNCMDEVHLGFRFIGEESDFIEFFIDDILIEGEEYDWIETETSSNGPYDLDPDVWIESFFDVYYDREGYYRATFSLDTPLRGDWFDDNPNNDVYQAVFTVRANNPPDSLIIEGTNSGTTGTPYTFTFTSTDSDGDDVSYYIKWGDGTTPWTTYQTSGPPGYSESHTWSEQGTYTIEAKAKDTFGAESDWTTLSVSMPRNRAMQIPFLQFLQQYPILYQLLQRFLQL